MMVILLKLYNMVFNLGDGMYDIHWHDNNQLLVRLSLASFTCYSSHHHYLCFSSFKSSVILYSTFLLLSFLLYNSGK
ncbi:hypothetical protein K492DRAFT_67604 [Lichtheimia hyalospora FSU 10163]|nr:hypothetical protein K492DRAFT_67604 [Lichtheimia hyalospora FSU 10163]